MKKVAFLSMVGALGLVGCGGGGGGGDDDDDVVIFTDADPATAPDAGDIPPACNAVAQTGCAAGEKCAFILDDATTGDGHTGCVANGTVGAGAACVRPMVVGTSDNCQGGLFCYQDTCNEICTVQTNDCTAGSCIDFSDLDFDVCLPTCAPLLQDCTGTQGCYLTQNGPVCAGVVGGTGVAPGQPCTFLNDCSKGGGCFDDGMGGGVCLEYCDRVACPPDATTMMPIACSGGSDPGPGANPGQGCLPAQLCGGITGEEIVGVCVDP